MGYWGKRVQELEMKSIDHKIYSKHEENKALLQAWKNVFLKHCLALYFFNYHFKKIIFLNIIY